MTEQMIFVQHSVSVLMRRFWAPLDRLCDVDPDVDELAKIVAPALAQQALYHHVAANLGRYRQLGIQQMAFHPTASNHHEPGTLDLVSKLETLVATASMVHGALAKLPNDLFWPMEGTFFSAADEGRLIAPTTWKLLRSNPTQYELVNLWVTASLGERVFDSYLVGHGGDGWRLCTKCLRAYQMGEYIFYDGATRCPYWCHGEIELHSWSWEEVQRRKPGLPSVPRKWVFYRFLDMD